MLYGFRSELAQSIANEGYHFTVYVPYGDDWFAYFMRRLAERPQNLSLAFKEFTNPKVLKGRPLRRHRCRRRQHPRHSNTTTQALR